AALPVDFHSHVLCHRLAAPGTGSTRPLPLSHARRAAGDAAGTGAGPDLCPLLEWSHSCGRGPTYRGGACLRLPAHGDRILSLLLSALDRLTPDGGCVERAHLVLVRQTLAQLVSLLLDQSGLALAAGCLALGLGLAAAGPA